jgi:hypothetical protein
MAGAVYFIVLIAIGAVVAATAGTVFLLFPFVAIALGVLIVPAILAALRNSSVGHPSSPPHGTANTREASYEPVRQPEERRRTA